MSLDLKRSIVIEIDGSGAVVGARQVSKALEDINKSSGRAGQELSSRMGQAEGATRSAASSMSALSGATSGFVKALAASAVGLFVKDMTMLSARYETLGVVMNVVGQNAGYTRSQMASLEDGLKKTGISAIESRKNLAVMTQANIDLAKSTELARIAQDAAVIGNINSSDAFQRLIYGIQSAQVEMLRTIGLNVSFEQSYKKLGDQMGKNAADLTENEKTQARLNAVLEKAPSIAGAYAASMDTAGKKMNSLARLSEDAKVALGAVFQPALNGAVDLLTEALKRLNAELTKTSDAEKIDNIQRVLDAALKRKSAAERRLRQAENLPGGNSDAIGSAQSDIDREEALIGRLLAAQGSLGKFAKSSISTWQEIEKANMNAAMTFIVNEENKRNAAQAELDAELKTERQKIDAQYKAWKDAGVNKKQLDEWYAAEKKKIDDKANKESIAAAKREVEERKRMFEQLDEMQREGQLKLTESQDRLLMRNAGMEEAKTRAQAYMTDLQQKDLKLMTEFSEKFAETVTGETQLKLQELDTRAKAYLAAGSDEVAVATWVAQEKLKLSEKWQDGVSRGLKEYATDARNAAQVAEDAIVGGFRNMEDALVEFITTGKLEFSDLADSIISDLARIAVQQTITGPLAEGAGDFIKYLMGGGASGASVMPSGASGLYYSVGHHAGGIVGSEPTFMRAVNPAIFAGADRFHTGGIAGDEVPAILKRGEGVFTKGQMAALGGGGGMVVNIIESPGNGGKTQQRQENGVNILDVMVEQIKSSIASDINRGSGVVPQAITKSYGLSRAPGAY